MENKELYLATVFMELLLKYGIPAAVQIVGTLKTDQVSIEDIRALKNRVPKPETYFGKSG